MSSCQANGSAGSSSIRHIVNAPHPSQDNGSGESSSTTPGAGTGTGAGSSGACGSDMDQPSVAEGSPEVLGSVVHNHELENGEKNSFIQLRTSARVSKKMRLDSIASQPPPDKKDVPKEEDKVDTKPKRRPFELWPQEDKNTFFEALNEFGKDFDAIQRYFEAKAKRKNLPEHMVKNKEQIRHFYYRTWNNISKHLRFPDEVKKATQELYGLINFGELRKKIGGVSEKTSLRLNELIYRGFTRIRERGKTIRIKTPICRALRKLNQQEELAEDLKLPPRVTVELRPRTVEAWARVQSTAQNPRIQTVLPLQRRLSSLLSFLEQRWKPNHVKYCERLQSQLNEVCANIDVSSTLDVGGNGSSLSPNNEKHVDKEDGGFVQVKNETNVCSTLERLGPLKILRVAPKSDVPISPVTVNLGEYLTSTRLSLKSHEGRLGNHGAEELFNSMLQASSKGCGRRGAKRLRHDSLSEKRKEPCQQQPTVVDSSPEKSKDSGCGTSISNDNEDEKPSCPFRLFGSGVCLDPSSSSGDSGNNEVKASGETGTFPVIKSPSNIKEESDSPSHKPPIHNLLDPGPSCIGTANQNSKSSSAESNEDIIKRVRNGWTLDNATAVTIGELYLMFGADSKLKLEFWWEDAQTPTISNTQEVKMSVSPPVSGPSDAVSSDSGSTSSSEPLASTLKKLLSIAKTYNTKTKSLQCPCGHICNGTSKSAAQKPKVSRLVRASTDCDKTPKMEMGVEVTSSSSANRLGSSSSCDGLFRRPLLPSPQFKPPPRPGTADAFKAQLEKFHPRFCNRRGRPASARKTVVVPRMLPLLPKAPATSSVVTLQIVPQGTQISGEFLPIAQCRSVLNFTPTPSNSGLPASRQAPRKTADSTMSSSADVGTPSAPSMPDITTSVGNISMPDLCQESASQSNNQDPLSTQDHAYEQPRSIRLVQDLFPATLDTPVNSPPSISNLLDMSLPSELNLTPNSSMETNFSSSNSSLETNFSGLLPNNSGVSSSPPPASPSSILKETDNQWLNAEVGDFSFSSFLGHLESPLKTVVSSSTPADNIEQSSMPSDVEAHMQSLMGENSLDYMVKFADLAARMASDGAGNSEDFQQKC